MSIMALVWIIKMNQRHFELDLKEEVMLDSNSEVLIEESQTEVL